MQVGSEGLTHEVLPQNGVLHGGNKEAQAPFKRGTRSQPYFKRMQNVKCPHQKLIVQIGSLIQEDTRRCNGCRICVPHLKGGDDVVS